MTIPLSDETVSAIKTAVKEHHDDPDFPKMSDYDTDEDEVKDFLFDSQVIEEGTMETEKKRLTRIGIIFVIPVAIMACFTFDAKLRLLIGVCGGIVACTLYLLGEKAYQHHQDKKLAASGPARYCDAVLKHLQIDA